MPSWARAFCPGGPTSQADHGRIRTELRRRAVRVTEVSVAEQRRRAEQGRIRTELRMRVARVREVSVAEQRRRAGRAGDDC